MESTAFIPDNPLKQFVFYAFSATDIYFMSISICFIKPLNFPFNLIPPLKLILTFNNLSQTK